MRLRCQRPHPTVPREWLPWQSAIQANYAQRIWGTASSIHEPVQELMNLPQLLGATAARLYTQIPQSWHAAAVAAGMHIGPPGADGQEAAPADMVAVATHKVLEGWGWVPHDSVGDLAPARAVSVLGGAQRVRDVTSVLLTPVVKQRVARHRQYAVTTAETSGMVASCSSRSGTCTITTHIRGAGRAIAAVYGLFTSPLGCIFRQQTQGCLWRLTAQGIAGAGGHDICLMGPCPCG